MFGKGSVTSSAMNQHKEMASKGSGAGVGKYPGRTAAHNAGQSELEDGARGAKPGIAGRGGLMQAAPDHGDMGKSHFNYGGKS